MRFVLVVSKETMRRVNKRTQVAGTAYFGM
jgi:hypothetical protein